MSRLVKIMSILLVIAPFFMVLGQESEEFRSGNLLLETAQDLFYKKKYASAQKLYEQIIAQENDANSELSVSAQYHRAVCALNLFNRDAEFLLNDFLKKHPDSRWTESIYFQLGTYSYRKKDHEDVVYWLSQVNPSKLPENDKTAYYFKLGYSNFHLGNRNEALGNFARIKDVEGDYLAPTNYYYGHLNYETGRYETALESFTRIKEDENFKELVKYYLVHIYFQQKRYEQLLSYAVPLLEEEETLRKEEISRLVGEAYYHQQDFEKALPYLEAFSEGGIGRSENDNYQLAYCYYKTGKYSEAIRFYNYVVNAEGRLGQIANYQLADCYLQKGDKKLAREAFRAASKKDFDKQIQEDALFNYAKLAYELSYNPYNEAISAFEEYLNKYPESDRVDEVNEILIYVYLTTRNYEAALASIEKIEKKDFRLRSAYQYLAFNRGVELFLAKNYREALAQFQKVGQYQMEKKLITSALFWQGECYYQMANYDLAAGAYSRFTSRGDAYGTGYYHKAQYNLGYCYFKQQDFESAKKSFRDFVTGRSNVEPELMSDGLTRTADCYFVQKDYLTAADFYQRATKLKQAEEDYAQFQLAICQGFLDKSGDKIASLENYEKRYPESPYIQDALYELGDAYFKKGENQQALASFNRLVEEYPNGVWTKKALLTSGLIFYRNKQVDEALATFKRIAEQYPDYKEAKEAIQRAEDIYVELGRIEEYNNWVEGLSFANVSTAGLDSVNYRAAENFFTKGDCEAAIDAFERYLKKFEPAIFAVNAHFYMAECYFRAESYDLAQKNYQFIADQPDNKFTEPALITVAYLNYLDSNYSMALDQYRRLEQLATFKTNRIEAKIGQMRCYKQLDKARETMDYANKVLFYSGIPDDKRVEALLTKADAERRLGRIEDAYTTYDSLASFTRSEEGAEARFKMAEIKYEQGNYVDAQEIIYESTNIKPVYDKWLAKSFILLSDVLLKMDDYFQAKATLQSIIDFHEGDDIVELAKSKLQNILELEAKENEGESKDLEINVGGKDQKEYEKLFESEKVDPDKQGPAADSTIQKTAKQP